MLALLASGGCARKRVAREAGAAGSRGSHEVDAGTGVTSGAAGSVVPGVQCFDDPQSLPIRFDPVRAVDLLFVVDDSPSMAAVQQQLRDALPHLVHQLGLAVADTSVDSMHLGVVSGDLGLAGVEGVEGCSGLGRNGTLYHDPPADLECARNQPAFVSFVPARDDRFAMLASDLACATSLAATGCSLQQPLEAALMAVWPADDARLLFAGEPGRGTTSNAGFLRDGEQARSLLAIVVVTNKDDCSLLDPVAFAAGAELEADTGERLEARLNARCGEQPSQLLDVERHVRALELLRPPPDRLYVFAAIAGVPRFTSVDFGGIDPEDDERLQDYYDEVLADPAMQVRVDDHGTPGPEDDTPGVACEGNRTRALPARRLVEAARRAGSRGVVGSICEDDFSRTMSGIAERAHRLLGDACLATPLQRDREGLVACELIWTLPAAGSFELPAACGSLQFPFLRPVQREPLRSPEGGVRCVLPQLPVRAANGAIMAVPAGNGAEASAAGWFYDDFTSDTLRQCRELPRRIALSKNVAHPPPEVQVTLECTSMAFGAPSANMGCAIANPTSE